VVFVAGVLFVLYKIIDVRTVIALFSGISILFFAITVFICTFDKIFMGIKWNLLLRFFDVKVPLFVPIIAYLRGKVFYLFTPLGLGMDAYKAYYLKEYDAPVSQVVLSIFVERVLGAISSISIILILLHFSLGQINLPHANMITAAGIMVFIGQLIFIYALIHYSDKLKKVLSFDGLTGKFGIKIHDFIHTVKTADGERKKIWYYYLLSLIEKIFYGTAIYFSAKAIGVTSIDYMYIVSATPLLALLERLPFSFSSIGLREGLVVVLFNPFVLDPSVSITIALTLRLAEITMMIFCSLLWLGRYDGASFRKKIYSVNNEIKTLRSQRSRD
jgi:uncharacterized protein (TIRG00374 family)